MEMERKSVEALVEVKASEDGVTRIRAYALAFGNPDSYNDIITSGACDKWLASPMADRMAFCWQHDFDKVIGKITAKGVDERGMWFEADILPTRYGKDAATLIKAGAIREFSIGYRADEYHYAKTDGDSDTIRYLDAITVFEVSAVTLAANDRATLESVKSLPEAIDLSGLPDAELERLAENVETELDKRVMSKILTKQ